MRGILGKKLGMTRFFDEQGGSTSATVIEAGPCTVIQVKTDETDGYAAVQLGFIDQKEKHVTKPRMGHFKKADVSPKRVQREFRDYSAEVKAGDAVNVDMFTIGDRLRISGISKGKGFAGVMKRHGFAGGQASHGQSDRQRAPGSIGQSAWPKRVFKGIRMGGRMGTDRITVRNVRVLKIIPERNLIVVQGAVPGSRNSIVEIRG